MESFGILYAGNVNFSLLTSRMPLPCHQHECLKTPFKDFVNIQTNQYSMNANTTRKSQAMAAGGWLLEYKFNALAKPAIMC